MGPNWLDHFTIGGRNPFAANKQLFVTVDRVESLAAHRVSVLTCDQVESKRHQAPAW